MCCDCYQPQNMSTQTNTPASTASAASSASTASSASATAKLAKDAVLNANFASICAMEAFNKAAATEASRGKALSLVKSIRRAKTAAMAAAAAAVNAASKKGFVETAVSLEKQARAMEALIEEQVAKEVTSANEDCVKLKAVALAYAAAAAEAATAAKMRLRASTILRYEVLEDAVDPGFVARPKFTSCSSSITTASGSDCSSVD